MHWELAANGYRELSECIGEFECRGIPARTLIDSKFPRHTQCKSEYVTDIGLGLLSKAVDEEQTEYAHEHCCSAVSMYMFIVFGRLGLKHLL